MDQQNKAEEIFYSGIITESAIQLMDKYALTDKEFLGKEIVTKKDVKEVINKRDLLNFKYPWNKVNRVAIIGAGSGAIQVIDLIRTLDKYEAVSIYDDTPDKAGKNLGGIPIIGKVDINQIVKDYMNNEFDFIINSVSTSIAFRKKCYLELTKLGVKYCNLIHDSVYIGMNLNIGAGNIIFPHCHIGACTFIGNDNFITANSSLEHHNKLGDHCTFGPAVMTSGHVTIGNEVKFGTGIYIEPLITIGNNSLISSGSIITKDIEVNTIVRNVSQIEYVKKRD